nr:type II secretion system F family protein [Pirellulaceae bacterium]
MPDFAYIARDNSGQRVTGSVAAASEREVLSILSGKSLFPISVTLEKAQTNPLSRKRVGGQLMATTYSQLASLLRSGVPLLRSIHVLRHQTSNARLREVLDDIYRRVEDGSTLGEAMSRYPRVFSEMAINMVRAGGEGGFLEDALERVSQFTEQQEDLKSRTAGALAYPVFLAIIGTLVVGGLVIFFVPRFAAMFDSLRQRGELPAMTDWLLAFSTVLRRYGLIVVAVVVVAAVM